MAQIWSSGLWQPKPNQEAAFVAAWRDFGEWTSAAHGPATAWLLRNRDRPVEFMSIGPWPSEDAINAWRSDPEFGARIAALRDLLDSFEARTFDPVAAIG